MHISSDKDLKALAETPQVDKVVKDLEHGQITMKIEKGKIVCIKAEKSYVN